MLSGHPCDDAIDVYGDTAVVRTHHHAGQTVIENGRQVPDHNCEVFVLRNTDNTLKIIFFIFKAEVQGQG